MNEQRGSGRGGSSSPSAGLYLYYSSVLYGTLFTFWGGQTDTLVAHLLAGVAYLLIAIRPALIHRSCNPPFHHCGRNP